MSEAFSNAFLTMLSSSEAHLSYAFLSTSSCSALREARPPFKPSSLAKVPAKIWKGHGLRVAGLSVVDSPRILPQLPFVLSLEKAYVVELRLRRGALRLGYPFYASVVQRALAEIPSLRRVDIDDVEGAKGS